MLDKIIEDIKFAAFYIFLIVYAMLYKIVGVAAYSIGYIVGFVRRFYRCLLKKHN